MGFNVILFTDAPSPDNFTRGYGAYRIATEIRKLGYSVLTVDFSSALTEETFDQILDLSIDESTLFVGFSTTWFPHFSDNGKQNRWLWGEKTVTNKTTNWNPTEKHWYYDSVSYRISSGELSVFVSKIKNRNPNTKVVLGGCKSAEYIKDESVDNIFIGYSENQIVDYIKSITKSGPLRIFNKIVDYDIKANNGSFVFKESFTEYVETDCLLPEERLTIEFSRGCIFNCTFCSFLHKNQNTKDYIKYKEILRQELMDNWTKWGVYKYAITDDTFNDHTEKLELINEVVQSLPFKPIFSFAFIRIDLITPEQAKLIKDIGVTAVFIGIDAWGKEPASVIKKSGNMEKIFKCFKIAKEYWGDSIHVTSNLIIGLPYDTEQNVKDSVNWFITEGKNYMNKLSYYSFVIRTPLDIDQYQTVSDIQKAPDTWGYSFPDPENIYYWENNTGDIKTSTRAQELMIDAMNTVRPHYNKTEITGWNELYANDEDIDSSEMFRRLTVEGYFPRLINVLSKYKRTSD